MEGFLSFLEILLDLSLGYGAKITRIVSTCLLFSMLFFFSQSPMFESQDLQFIYDCIMTFQSPFYTSFIPC
jgi:hypothetical protein